MVHTLRRCIIASIRNSHHLSQNLKQPCLSTLATHQSARHFIITIAPKSQYESLSQFFSVSQCDPFVIKKGTCVVCSNSMMTTRRRASFASLFWYYFIDRKTTRDRYLASPLSAVIILSTVDLTPSHRSSIICHSSLVSDSQASASSKKNATSLNATSMNLSTQISRTGPRLLILPCLQLPRMPELMLASYPPGR